ncbi:ThiF family adenylyltransferase [Lachnospira multipara]|uniref:ThiF family adenylyltransferase n=1 Tax=Lachnospira multipara TaxID=28051 RepID=UPI000482BAB6|nr:ThiF family adenylyltransferase [Lachnospira multipara]
MKKYRLVNVSQVLRWENSILLVDDEITVLEPYDANLMNVLKKMLDGITDDELVEIGRRTNMDVESFLESLRINGILGEYFENDYLGTVCEKQWEYLYGLVGHEPNLCQKNIENAMVCIIGLGGVGTIVIDSLMRAGVKKFVLIDCDEVSITNLNRQIMYNGGDIGIKKTECMRKKIKDFDSKIEVHVVNKRIEMIKDLSDIDSFSISIIINAADRPNNITDIIFEYAKSRKIAALTAAVGRNQGSWGPLIIPGKTQSYDDFKMNEYNQMEAYEKYILTNSASPMNVSFGPINAIISYFLSKDIIMHIAGANEYVLSYERRCGFDFLNMQFMS